MSGIRFIAVFASVFLSGIEPARADASLAYVVEVSAGPMPSARVTLTIPQSDSAKPPVLLDGAKALDIQSQVSNVACGGVAVAARDGKYALPAGCREVTWRVAFVRPGPDGILSSDQQSVLMPGGWFIFSESSSLLRLAGMGGASPAITFSGDVPRVASTLKPVNWAPSFFVLGEAPRLSLKDGPMTLTYFGDDLAAVQKVIAPAMHMEGLAYYREIIGPSLIRHVDELKVVWMRITQKLGAFGGASGHDTFLANYADHLPPEHALKPFVTVLHEQFHQIDGGKNRPQWVSESLAQYYALKASLRVSKRAPDFVANWDRWFDRAAKEEGRLLDVQRRVNGGDFSDYGLFYSRGSMFWRDVDAALTRADGRGLDRALPVILGASIPADGTLPPEVMRALSAIPAPEMATLLQTYL